MRDEHIPRSRQRIFLAILLLTPVLLLVGLELGLRTFGYGPDLRLFRTETIAGKQYFIMNPEVKGRYFYNVPFAPTPSPDFFLAQKPKGVYRIFCLGGSTTVGYPYWFNGSFSSFLRDRLRALAPDKKVEVVNIGMTATNSYTVNDMARELKLYEPDLLIVYDGHNEFYGAMGVASHESVGGSRQLTRLYLRLVHLKTFQLLRNWISGVASLFRTKETSGYRATMMERLAHDSYIALDDPLYQQGLANFRDNLKELSELCTSMGIPCLVGTQVSNLRGLPPFHSEFSRSTTESTRQEALQKLQSSVDCLGRSVLDSALVLTDAVLKLDSTYAQAHFVKGTILEKLKRVDEAKSEYIRARDYDALRFRASSDFNRAILETAAYQNFIPVDVEAMIAANSPHGIPGKELITEHLHPNARGFFLIAKVYADAMRTRALFVDEHEWRRADTLDEVRLWSERPVTMLDERIAARRTEILTSSWPFTDAAPSASAIDPRDTLGVIAEQATKGQIDWAGAHKEAIDLYQRNGDWRSVVLEYKAIINQIPLDIKNYHTLAYYLLQRQRPAEMKDVLVASLEVEKTVLAYRAVADYFAQQKDFGTAAVYYRGTLQFLRPKQEEAENRYLLALALLGKGDRDGARQELLTVLTNIPDYPPAVQLLSRIQIAR